MQQIRDMISLRPDDPRANGFSGFRPPARIESSKGPGLAEYGIDADPPELTPSFRRWINRIDTRRGHSRGGRAADSPVPRDQGSSRRFERRACRAFRLEVANPFAQGIR